MPILKRNTNPNNDSKYARHRSIWKGERNQLRETVTGLKGSSQGERVKVYLQRGGFDDKEGGVLPLGVQRVLGTFIRHWEVRHPVPERWSNAVPSGLRGDLELIWHDFNVVVHKRSGEDYTGNSLIVFAPSRVGFDIIFSKYGYGETVGRGEMVQTMQRNHKFYQWQSRLMGVEDLVNVDDF